MAGAGAKRTGPIPTSNPSPSPKLAAACFALKSPRTIDFSPRVRRSRSLSFDRHFR
ncbi:unnamed protein product [Prunus armeniaca]